MIHMAQSKREGPATRDTNELLDLHSNKLDQIIDLLQDLIVLQAAGMSATNEDIRKALQLNMNRVSKISRLARRSPWPDRTPREVQKSTYQEKDR